MTRQFNGLVLAFLFIASSGCASGALYSYPPLEADRGNLVSTVEYLTGIVPPRNYTYPSSLLKAAEFIQDEFEAMGFAVSIQEFEVQGNIYRNIIVSAGPESGPRFILGAHYDVYGNLPGADDNASGVAGLLEVARLVKKHEALLGVRIDFVAFTLEEPPFFRTDNMGSYIHARSLHEGNTDLRGMAVLEMIGYFVDEEASQQYPFGLMKLFYPKRGNFIGVVGKYGNGRLIRLFKRHMRNAAVEVRSLSAPAWLSGVDFSDHMNYWRFGYDAVMITDTAFYRNPGYHEAADTIDTLDFDRMKEVVKGVAWTLINAD